MTDRVAEYLTTGSRGRRAETIKPEAACFERVQTRIVANARLALDAAVSFFHGKGVTATIIDSDIDCEAHVAAEAHAALVRQSIAAGQTRPIALISGGETRVKVTGNGRGGRNSHYLLSLAQHLADTPGVYALAADTDGIDGTEDNAGAYLTPEMWPRAKDLGLSAAEHLDRNDAYSYFAALDALVMTGPTRTNVNDYRVILIT